MALRATLALLNQEREQRKARAVRPPVLPKVVLPESIHADTVFEAGSSADLPLGLKDDGCKEEDVMLPPDVEESKSWLSVGSAQATCSCKQECMLFFSD